MCSESWGPRGILKYDKNTTSFQDPPKPHKLPSGHPKPSQMTPKSLPQDTQLVNKWKKSNHSKTIAFTMLIAHTATAFWRSFPSLDHLKHGPRNCFPLWHPKSEKNHKKVSKVSPKRSPKCILKSIKIDTWTSRCLVGVPVDPWITTIIPQDTKMEPRGLQNHRLGYKK